MAVTVEEDEILAAATPKTQADDVPGPASITVQVVREDGPRMMLVNDFVSPEEIDHLISLAEGKWKRSLTTRGNYADLLEQKPKGDGGTAVEAWTEHAKDRREKHDEIRKGDEISPDAAEPTPEGKLQDVKSQVRTSMEYPLGYSESRVVERILARVATLTGHPYENLERPVLLRYEAGNFFKLHHDGGFRPYSLIGYLNDVEEAGETYFPHLGLKVRPVKGTAVLWKNTMLNDEGETVADLRAEHEGLPPAEGYVKYALAMFVNSRAQTNASHIQLVHLTGQQETSAGESQQDPESS